MAAAPSQTRIVNRALSLLGTAQRIASITDNTPLAKAALAVWDDARDGCLAEHPWNFAIGRAQLAASADAPTFGYDFAYALPADHLRWLPPAPGDRGYFKAEQEGNLLLSSADAPLNIRYIRRVEDLSIWSIGFIVVMGHRLAWDMVDAASGGIEGLAQRMQQRYEIELDRAKRQDALATGDRSGRQEFRSNWLAARGGWED
ncbi:hypothetical protein [Sphingomonas oligoaromativorans]|uniref:hypothetical protein n=1 Tax=Sphingomonas oligoaromativorans TaxID=575322 RepID=UPI00142124B8|nr:hypothetical protein [Sphingomonas oligoaromativorans]NIJ34336.1 hypothetical protein [Sphingomonas oligoaromativorans]